MVLAWHVVGALAAPVLLVLGIAFAPAPIGSWCKSVFRGGDYTVAAVFGGDGKHSCSAYCGRAMAMPGGSRLLVAIGKGIDLVFGSGHCAGAFQREFPQL